MVVRLVAEISLVTDTPLKLNTATEQIEPMDEPKIDGSCVKSMKAYLTSHKSPTTSVLGRVANWCPDGATRAGPPVRHRLAAPRLSAGRT